MLDELLFTNLSHARTRSSSGDRTADGNRCTHKYHSSPFDGRLNLPLKAFTQAGNRVSELEKERDAGT